MLNVQCTPTIRKWPGQRCTSCEEHDLPCGPNIHARYSATTKLGNSPTLWYPAPDCTEARNSAPAKTTRWDGTSDFESASSLPSLDIQDWDFSLEVSDELLQDCVLNRPHEKAQHQPEPWSGMTIDLSQIDKSLRENKPNLPGSITSAIPDDHREIDQRSVACHPWNRLADHHNLLVLFDWESFA
jgi:hypothetical protein